MPYIILKSQSQYTEFGTDGWRGQERLQVKSLWMIYISLIGLYTWSII